MPYKDPQKQKEWEQTNREKRLKQKKEYYQKYKEKEKLRIKEWYQENKEIQRQKHREYQKEYRLKPEIKQKQRENYNSEADLRAQIKYLKKLSHHFNTSYNNYRSGLISWSKTCKKRDNKQCNICGSTHKLNSHHIFYKSKYPELSLNLNNGVTLCHLHHREVHKLN